MNILFAMQSPEYLRFYDSTIRALAARGHRIVIAINKQNDAKPVRLEGMDTGEAVAVIGVLPRRTDVWRGVSRRLRGLVDFVRYLHPRFTQAPALRARIRNKVLPPGFRVLDRLPSLSAGLTNGILGVLHACERAIPSSAAIEDVITREHADLVLVSPLVDAASDQVDLVKSAHALGVPVGACIASWDNLTNKGQMRVTPDAVFVWNDAQKREAVEYHGIPADRVVTTGAQVFDRWFDRVAGGRATFCARVGLPPDRPFLLYTCSSSFIAISHAEIEFVRTWITAVRAVPELRDLGILIRPHPYNITAWETADLSQWPNVAVWPRGAYNPMEEEGRSAFFDSIFHSVAVVGINTSAMIEAAIIGRPVLSLVADRFTGTQEGTLHFHYLLPENGGFLRMTHSLPEHVDQLRDVLADPETVRRQTERFVASFVRPHGVDRPCTPILADAIERLGASGRLRPERTPSWAPLLWPCLLAANAYSYCCAVATDRKVASKLVKQVRGRLREASRTVKRSPDKLRRRVKRVFRAVEGHR